MVRILVIGDPHFKVSGVLEHQEMIAAVLTTAKQQHPDIIVVLGDVLDRHETIHVSPLTRAVDFLIELSTITKTFVLIGNHDLKNNRQFLSKEHALIGLRYPNLTIVDTPTTEVLDDLLFVFCPYVPPGRFDEALDVVPNWSQATAIFAHQEFYGANMDGLQSTDGDRWSLNRPLVISGHIHTFQILQPNLLYPGTPMQHNFGDDPNKGLSLFMFQKDQFIHTRLDLLLKKKIVLRTTRDTFESLDIPSNCHVKVCITCPVGSAKSLRKHPLIRRWISEKVLVTYAEEKETRKSYEGTAEKKIVNFTTTVLNHIRDDSFLVSIYQELCR